MKYLRKQTWVSTWTNDSALIEFYMEMVSLGPWPLSESSDAIEHYGSALAWGRKSDRIVALTAPERLLAYYIVEHIPVFCALSSSCGVTMTLFMEKRAQVRVLSVAGLSL